MIPTLLVVYLPLLALAATNPRSPFTATASKHGGEFDGKAIQAWGQNFYVGLAKPQTYCPVGNKCPPGTSTVFGSQSNTASLDVTVPGGQRVYVNSDGSLGYTQAHSATTPAGSSLTGFKLSPFPPHGDHGKFTYEAKGAKGNWLACPVNSPCETKKWKVYANIQGVKSDGCTIFDISTTPTNQVGAWQYT